MSKFRQITLKVNLKILVVFGLFSWLLVGCTTYYSVSPPLNTWVRKPMPLKICTQKDETVQNGSGGPLSSAVYNVWRKWIFDSLAQTWGSVPGVSFIDAGECGPSVSAGLKITIKRGGAWGYCGQDCTVSGHSNSAGTDGDTGSNTALVLKNVAVHEVGHALGLLHEHQMPGRPPLCQREQAILDGCTQCVATSPCTSQILCKRHDFNLCFLTNVGSDQVLTEDQCNSARGRIADRTPVSGAKILTVYDPLSIMNYCSSDNGRSTTDYHPTRLDLLGMEILYSVDRPYPLGCLQNCIYTLDGVILRTNGILTSDWTARGAVNVIMYWSSISGQNVSAAYFPPGVSQFYYNFKNPWNEMRHGNGKVIKSDLLHAAILSAIVY